MADKLKYNDIVYDEIISYNVVGSSTNIDYYAIEGDFHTLTLDSYGYPEDDESSDTSYGVRVMKQLTPTSYIELTLTDGRTIFYPKDEEPAENIWTRDNHTFRLPVSSTVLERRTFYTSISLYDSLVSGIVYTSQTITIKWYERGWVAEAIKVIVYIAAAVIVVSTAGAGSNIAGLIVTAAESYALSLVASKITSELLDVFGINDPFLRAAVSVIVSAMTGAIDTSSLTLMMTKLATQYMKYEIQETIDDAIKIAKESKEFFEEMKKNKSALDAEVAGMTPARTTEQILQNILNQEDRYIDGEYVEGSYYNDLFNPETVENMSDSSWMVPLMTNLNLTPTNVLSEKGIIEDISIDIPTIDISLGVENNTFIK